MSEDVQCHWFAATVKSRHEKAVAEQLHNKGIEEYLPLYQAKRPGRNQLLNLPLFPQYVFCRFAFGERITVLRTPGIYSVVGFGGRPTPIPEDEIEAVRRTVESGLPVGPWPFLRAGSRVRLARGPLADLEGILIRERNALRVVVSVELLHRSIAVEVDRDMIAAVKQTDLPAHGMDAPAAIAVPVGQRLLSQPAGSALICGSTDSIVP